MKPMNFPGRKQARLERALDRMAGYNPDPKKYPTDEAKAAYEKRNKAELARLNERLVGDPRGLRSKKQRGSK